MKVAVITTVRNEENGIDRFFSSIFNQSLQPDEIIISDGGSTDKTLDKLHAWQQKDRRIVLVNAPGNIAVGRNAAIDRATAEIIAVTDAGQTIDKNWLKEITRPFDENSATKAVAGFFKPDPKTLFEKVSTALVNETEEEIGEDWLPSSRSVAFKKAVWQKVGGYPEQLSFAGEDTLFDLRIKKAGHRFIFAPKAVTYWRPRPNLKSFYRQFYLYAKGDGQYWPKSVGYTKKFVFYGLILSGVLLGLFYKPILLYPLLLYVAYILFRSRKAYQRSGKAAYLFLSLPLVVVFDFATIFGYLRGVIDWLSHKELRKLENYGV